MSPIELVKQLKLNKAIKKMPLVERFLGLFYFGIFRKPYFSRAVEIQLGQQPIRLDYRFGHYRYEEFGDRHNGCFQRWIELCRGKKVVFDVGAHIGLYALAASRLVAPGGKIYAFEPSFANGRYLQRHCDYNHFANIEIVPHLLGRSAGRTVIFYESGDVDAMNAVVPRTGQHYRKVLKKEMSLDAFCRENQVYPEVMKMDVEGAECDVLAGAQQMLKEHHPVIILSVHPSRLVQLGESTEALYKTLQDLGYRIEDEHGRPVTGFDFAEYLLYARKN